jgi:putative inorganic carbon (HCO3(-)) transporter
VPSNPAPAAAAADAPATATLTSPNLRVDWARATVWGLYLVAAGLPLYVVRWHIGPLPTTLLEFIILATAASYALSLHQNRTYRLRRTPVDIPTAVLLVAGVISIVVAVNVVAAAGIYRAYFLEAVAVFYIAVDVLERPRDIRGLLIAAGAGASLFALGQVATFATVVTRHQFQLGAPPTFVFTSSNSVALFLEPPLVFAAAFLFYPSRPRERWFALAFLACLVPGAVVTLSRGMYVAIAVMVVVAVFTARDPRQKLLITASAAVAIVVLVLLPIVQQRLATSGLSLLQRLVIYQQAWTVIQHRPLFGPGLASYAAATAPLRSPHQWPEIYPHNLWLTFWSETGLLGLLSFAALYGILLVRGWRAIRNASGLGRTLLYGGVGTLIVYLVHGMVDTPYWKNDLAVEFWLVAALIVVGLRSVCATFTGAPSSIAAQARPTNSHR